MNAKYRVDMIETDWCQRLEEQRDFDIITEAELFVRQYNSRHSIPGLPCYIRATEPYLVDLDVVKPPRK